MKTKTPQELEEIVVTVTKFKKYDSQDGVKYVAHLRAGSFPSNDRFTADTPTGLFERIGESSHWGTRSVKVSYDLTEEYRGLIPEQLALSSKERKQCSRIASRYNKTRI